MLNSLENKDWNIGKIEVYIDVTKEGRMQLGMNIVDDFLNKEFPIDMRKQDLLSKNEWKRYEQSIFRKREDWIKENIPAGRYSTILTLDSETLEVKST